jgi:hypothetical protein
MTGGSPPAQTRPVGVAGMVQPVPQGLPAVTGAPQGESIGTRPEADALGAWATSDHRQQRPDGDVTGRCHGWLAPRRWRGAGP